METGTLALTLKPRSTVSFQQFRMVQVLQCPRADSEIAHSVSPRLQALRTGAEQAQGHGDLAGMVDGVLDDAGEERFVRVGAAGNLFR
jgi:hypothetical protein